MLPNNEVCLVPGSGFPQLTTSRSINAYLDLKEVREILGVDPSVGKLQLSNHSVNRAFASTLDRFYQTQHWIAMLLERDIRVLIYVGEYDWICNWIGNEAFTLAMEWSGQSSFVAEGLGNWISNNKLAGRKRSAGPLTFLTLKGAGHMVTACQFRLAGGLLILIFKVPYDKPEEALDMVNRWIREQPL